MIEAAESIKNRAWSISCRSGEKNKTILFSIIDFLLTSLDRQPINKSFDKTGNLDVMDETKLSIILPDSKCCKIMSLKKKTEDNFSIFSERDEGASFVFVYFSAARGENGDDIRKTENKKLQDGVFGAIEQAVSADGGKNHAAETYRSILYDVATFSQPTGASLIKMGYEYNPSRSKEYGKILAWKYYEKYYIRFSEVLLDRIDVYLKMKELRSNNKTKSTSSELKDKVRIFAGQIEELDEECCAVTKTSASGMASIWLNYTDTKSIVVSKARKECSIFRDNVREKEEQKKEDEQRRKEEEKDRTDALFSIFAVLALVSCVWDGYCLFKELTPLSLVLFVISFSIVFLVIKIVLKGSWDIIFSHILKNWWIVAVVAIFSTGFFLLCKMGVIPCTDDANQIIDDQIVRTQNIEIQNVSKKDEPQTEYVQTYEEQFDEVQPEIVYLETNFSDTEQLEIPPDESPLAEETQTDIIMHPDTAQTDTNNS